MVILKFDSLMYINKTHKEYKSVVCFSGNIESSIILNIVFCNVVDCSAFHRKKGMKITVGKLYI